MIKVRQGNNTVFISNTEEHGVAVIPIQDLDTLIHELIQIKRLNDNKN
jgi:hypothetical protein|uniref:Uncharacterized protein n=1 Tax=Siphoviridae sp. cteLh2 TaxID=2825590 RepID=A0A8S5U5P5_9CAUD|nr:hypothetical protein [uncultured Lachnoclostridium sp.]DAF89801.1 MAG TPA: hypothetical protein [Siphoviridae sp. cteLh2]